MLIIFGGSFNPPTLAHKELIDKIKLKYNNAKIIIVPVSCKNYTWKHNLINDEDRYNMLKLMFNDIEISRYEFMIDKYEGTYKLLSDFKKIDKDIYFLIGSDNLAQMPLWLNFNNLIKDFKFIVVKRPGDEIDFKEFKEYENNFSIIEMNSTISSTKIRENVLKYHNWLDVKVFKYIKDHNLYEVNSKC